MSRPSRHGCGRHIAALALFGGLGFGSTALAHHQAAGSTAGLAVPSLTHGQMTMLAPHRAAILALADALPQPDAATRRLRNFAAIERSVCFWGLMPGSLRDETSPFNECAHAEYAALRALLLHLAEARGAAPAARALKDRLAREMAMQGEALTLCRYSDEPFNTAAPVGPDWRALPTHAPTLLTLLAAAAFSMAGILGAWSLRSRPARIVA